MAVAGVAQGEGAMRQRGEGGWTQKIESQPSPCVRKDVNGECKRNKKKESVSIKTLLCGTFACSFAFFLVGKMDK